jgi:peptide/nickel transport system substrate-binding protein
MVQEQAHRPHRRRRLTLIAGCALAAAVLTACGSSATSSGTSAGSGTSSAGTGAGSGQGPKSGGSVTVEEAGLDTQFDPALAFISTFTDGPEMEALYGPGLLYQNATTGAVEYGFAKSMTSTDNKVWTMTLRSGLKFSDGTPFNAAAVVANVKRIADPATGSSEAKIASTFTATAVNDTTVQFTLQKVNSQFPSVISQDFALVPSPTAVQKEGSSFAQHPVGAGPFMMGTLTPSVSLALVKNPNYSLYAANQPYLNNLTFEEVTDSSQSQSNLATGQAQAAAVTTGQQISALTGIGMTSITNHPVGGAWLDINQGKAPFNNLDARKAVYLALDQKGLANVWAPGNPVASNYFPQGTPYYDPSLNYPAGNSSAAQTLFNQLAAAGKPVNFTVLWPQGTNSTTAQYVASTLNAYKNVHVTVSVVLPAQYVMDLNQTQNYQMTAYGYYNSALFPNTAAVFGTGGALNYEKIADPKLDSALDAMQATSDQTAFKSALHDFVTELIAQYDILPAQQADIGFIYNAKSVGGVHPVEFGMAALWGEMYSLSA